MDRVRFGRALGRGARTLARVAYEAVDAAAAPAPSAAQTTQPQRSKRTPASARREVKAARRPEIAAARRSAGEALAPIRKASRAVSLQVSGGFFLIFGISFGLAALRFSAQLRTGGPEAFRAGATALVAAIFLYFGITNFVRASRLR